MSRMSHKVGSYWGSWDWGNNLAINMLGEQLKSYNQIWSKIILKYIGYFSDIHMLILILKVFVGWTNIAKQSKFTSGNKPVA